MKLLPLYIVLGTLLAAVWIGFGRALFGVMGWMALLTIFIAAPVILLYGLAMAIIVYVRAKKRPYSKNGPLVITLVVLAVALFIAGLTIVDGGDVEESIGSALTALLGNKSGTLSIAISGIICMVSSVVATIAAFAAFISAFVENGRRPARADPLKLSD